MKKNSKTVLGFGYGIGYALSVSISTIWLNKIGNDYFMSTLLFYSSLITIILLNVINFKNNKESYKNIYKDKLHWCLMSLMLVAVWYFTYYSTIHSSAEFYISIVFLVTATISAAFSMMYLKMSLCLLCISIVYYMNSSASFPALISSIIAGGATYSYYYFSMKFTLKTKTSPIGVLAIRFYFVFIFSIMFLLKSGELQSLVISLNDMILIIIFSIVNMFIPMVLCQSSFQIIGIKSFTFLTTLVPLLTFFIEFVWVEQTNSIYMFILYVIITLVLNFEKVIKLSRVNC